jgi:flagellar basal-body rod protein FlgG
MDQGILEISTKALVQEKRLEVLASNIANINTVGFKKDKVMFQIPNRSEGDAASAALLNLPFSTVTDFSPGPLKHTGNPLDLALEGDGFFCVSTKQGTQYTRKGNFTLDREGMLVTQDGLQVLGEGSNKGIKIEGSEVKIDEAGNIMVDGNKVDKLRLVDFENRYELVKSGNSLFRPASEGVSGTEPEKLKIAQGSVELANVQGIQTMTEMIDVLRGYESYQKAIKFMNDATSKTINEVGRF